MPLPKHTQDLLYILARTRNEMRLQDQMQIERLRLQTFMDPRRNTPVFDVKPPAFTPPLLPLVDLSTTLGLRDLRKSRCSCGNSWNYYCPVHGTSR